MKNLVTALAVLALAAPASLAFAQDDGFATGAAPARSGISREEAISIARDRGMTHVREVERDDGKWEVEGCTANRKEIEVNIHPSSGEIVKFEIDSEDDDNDAC